MLVSVSISVSVTVSMSVSVTVSMSVSVSVSVQVPEGCKSGGMIETTDDEVGPTTAFEHLEDLTMMLPGPEGACVRVCVCEYVVCERESV